MTILALINQNTMVCDNTSLDDRPASDIHIEGYIVLDLMQTPAYGWVWDGQQWQKFQKPNGEAAIGYVYENGALIEPKPEDPIQPIVEGTQEI